MTNPLIAMILSAVCGLAVCITSIPIASAQTMSLDGDWQFAVDSTAAFGIDNVREQASWRVGKHEGGYTPFAFDVRQFVNMGPACRKALKSKTAFVNI